MDSSCSFVFPGITIQACSSEIGTSNYSNGHWPSLYFPWFFLLWFSPFSQQSSIDCGWLCLNISYKPFPAYWPYSCIKFCFIIISFFWRIDVGVVFNNSLIFVINRDSVLIIDFKALKPILIELIVWPSKKMLP